MTNSSTMFAKAFIGSNMSSRKKCQVQGEQHDETEFTLENSFYTSKAEWHSLFFEVDTSTKPDSSRQGQG